MHELPITESILDIVLKHAGGQRVTDIHLLVGELSGFSEECIEFHWGILSEGTGAEGARLHFRRVAFELECEECGATFAPRGDGFACEACGSARVRVCGGEDLRVEAIDIDESAAAPSPGAREAGMQEGRAAG